MKKDLLLHLQSLRGIAALIIVFHHLKSLSSNLAQNDFMANSSLAVDFFFVLSGFVIALNYQHLLIKFYEIKNFIKKRFFRLYPLHIILLIIYLAIEILKYFLDYYAGIKSNEPPFSVSNLYTFFTNLFLIQGIIDNQLSYNEVSWSVSFEFYTYIIFALIIFFIRNKILFYLLIIILTIISFIFVYKLDLMENTNGVAFLRCTYSFFLGTLIYRLNILIKNIDLSILEIPIFIITIYLFCYIPNTVFMPIIFGVLILTLNQTNKGAIKSILKNSVLVFIGKISYSIYMLHYLIIWSHIQVLRFIFKFDTIIINDYTYVELDSKITIIVISSILVFVFLLSNLSFNFIEKKFLYKNIK